MPVREDIFGGLKLAVEKGETLEQAMISFFNAGYKREDIEETARVYQSGYYPQPVQPVQQAPQIQQSAQQKPVQKISLYQQTLDSKKIKEGIQAAIKQLESIDTTPDVKTQIKTISDESQLSYEQEKPIQKQIPNQQAQESFQKIQQNQQVQKPIQSHIIQKVSNYDSSEIKTNQNINLKPVSKQLTNQVSVKKFFKKEE